MADGTNSVGQPLKFQSVEDLERQINDYFQTCDEKGKPYTITGLALALDTSRETLLNYEKREQYFDTIKRAKLKCHNYAEDFLFTGKNATGAIFNLKNNYGWRDQTQVEQTGEVTYKYEDLDDEQLEKLVQTRANRATGTA